MGGGGQETLFFLNGSTILQLIVGMIGLSSFSGLSQHFYEIKFAYLSSTVLIKTEETCRNASIFSALGYQASIDASGAVGAMNFQTYGLVFWLT